MRATSYALIPLHLAIEEGVLEAVPWVGSKVAAVPSEKVAVLEEVDSWPPAEAGHDEVSTSTVEKIRMMLAQVEVRKTHLQPLRA